MSPAEVALLAQLAATWAMVGLIWFVQVVHYPLMATVGPADAVRYATDHQRLTGLVVGPPMLVEGLSTLWLLGSRPAGVSWWLPWAGGIALAVALGSTVALQVPLHERRARGIDHEAGRRLVTTNWVRTAAWSARGGLVLVMAAQALP